MKSKMKHTDAKQDKKMIDKAIKKSEARESKKFASMYKKKAR